MELSTTTQSMSSREIADLTNKPHSDLLKAIRKMESAWIKVDGGNFSLVEYIDSKGEKRPEYQLSKKECLYIATKFNDEARAKLILRWEELETKSQSIDFSNPNTILQLAQNWADEQRKRKQAEEKIRKLQPKADFLDKVLDTDEKIDIGQAAKILELPFGRNTMFKELRERGVFFKNRNEPKQEFIKRGYFQLKEKFIERSNHDAFVVIKVLVTQKGLEYLSGLFNSENQNKQLATIN